MYLDAKLEALASFGAAIEGDPDAAACVVGFGPAPEPVAVALRAACAGIGMPEPVCVDASRLSPADALFVLEGLDSRVLVIADELAAALVGEGYHASIPLDVRTWLLGRPCVAFTSFEADLSSERTKQRAWKLIKSLI